MKISYIIGLLVIAAAVGYIISLSGDTSQYVNFQEAFQLASQGRSAKVHVVGELTKNAQGEVVGVDYDPLKDANYLAFDLVDDRQIVQRVVCYNPPASMQDFKRSEKVVVIGQVKGDQFVASEILMKCPSKYEEKQVQQSSINN
jgi:cytochrome c-type biogenesis protein CcmE